MPLLPLARSSGQRVLSRGPGLLWRVVPTPNARLAIASTVGLSLATLYALSNYIQADAFPVRDEAIRALRNQKSTDKFSLSVPRDTESLLKQYEETHRPPGASGVLRYDIAQVASNNPQEDDHSEALVASNNSDSQWSFFAVIDGHIGWETSALLREELIPSVTAELQRLGRQGAGVNEDRDPISEAIMRGFTNLDDHIVHERVQQVLKTKSRSVATNLLAPAYAGACALLALYDSQSSILRIALTGDCRAVLGRRRADGKFDLEVLTADQNGNNPDEKKRLEEAHPGEEVVKNGRTMGFGPSRVFGDARYKWSKEIQQRLQAYLGRFPPDSIKTPPYFTAEPAITVTHVQPGDFVVLATDGLWECLTSREVVGLVGQWVHQQEGRGASWTDIWVRWWRTRRSAADYLPVVCDQQHADDTVRYPFWRTEKKFVLEDGNVATHLIRNALGGADEDLRQALLNMRSPRSRTYWDDITATVVFFGESG